MQKTKNYNLNQWEATDKISRADFNSDNAAIDAAIKAVSDAASQAGTAAGAAQNTAQVAASMATKAQEAADVVAADTMEQLLRVGYDLYQNTARSICAGTLDGIMKSAVFNSLTSADELSRMSGMITVSGGGGFLGSSTNMTLAKLNAAITSWTNGEIAEVVTEGTAYVQFKSTFRGTITSLDVWYHRTCSNNTGYLPIYIRLYDLDSKSYTYKSSKFAGSTLTNTTTSDTFAVSIPVEYGRNYRLELYTSGGLFYGTIGFGAYGTQSLTGTVTGAAATVGTVTESITLDSPARQAVALIHYAGGTAPTAVVDGATMVAATSRTGTSLKGTSCTELELRLSGEWSGIVPLTANFQSSADQNIYDVLFYLI